jgi:hypothetical protein
MTLSTLHAKAELCAGLRMSMVLMPQQECMYLSECSISAMEMPELSAEVLVFTDVLAQEWVQDGMTFDCPSLRSRTEGQSLQIPSI